jgi:asparagine synthase (glutamine-hydrolysing)
MLPDNLLLFNDKVTMANSIENRVPYLDIDLVNFIESLPVSFKLKGKVGKYLHREAVKGWIPNQIIYRKKRGFATPVDEWFQNELSETLFDLVQDANSFSRNYFDIKTIRRMVDLHQQKRHNYKNELFIILSLEMWFRSFYSKF